MRVIADPYLCSYSVPLPREICLPVDTSADASVAHIDLVLPEFESVAFGSGICRSLRVKRCVLLMPAITNSFLLKGLAGGSLPQTHPRKHACPAHAGATYISRILQCDSPALKKQPKERRRSRTFQNSRTGENLYQFDVSSAQLPSTAPRWRAKLLCLAWARPSRSSICLL